MNLDSLTNRSEYLSAHYLAEVLPGHVKKEIVPGWDKLDKAHREDEKQPESPRARLRAFRSAYLAAKGEWYELGAVDDDDPDRAKRGAARRVDQQRHLHRRLLAGLGFVPADTTLEATDEPAEDAEGHRPTVVPADPDHPVAVAHAEPGVVVIEAGWALDADAAFDDDRSGQTGTADDTGLLLDPVRISPHEEVRSAQRLTSYLLKSDDLHLRYVLILAGGVVVLADRLTWFEGRYLAVNLDVAFGRNDTSKGGELDVIAALISAEALRPPPEGGEEPLAKVRDRSRQHAVGVDSDLRDGIRASVETIAQEILNRIREQGICPEELRDPAELGTDLARQALRYLYRILFLLFAEARPELGVLPVDHPEYAEGYGLQRLGEIASRKLDSESAGRGFHLYESLDLLFGMVNEGHRPRRADETVVEGKTSEAEGIRFEPLRSDLFLPEKTELIGDIEHPGDGRVIDTRLRNACLHTVLRNLMITRGRRGARGGFISYQNLGINQLGAVYEGLMSYTGFIATDELYEVAKGGDPKDGSWMIPAAKVDEYPDDVFVYRTDPETGVRGRVRYPAGSFVYRLAGRDRQTSASYYTPQSLTEVTVQLALKYRIEEDGHEVKARELLDWTICEPALGSGAFLNEAINQVAAKYLELAQKEHDEQIDPERYPIELQKTKAYIALHNCYGVDLNRTAVELAEVSLWLNTMHPGLQAPWFGLHLRRGNSLIGAGRKTYPPEQVIDGAWLKTAPDEHKLSDGPIPSGAIHHFLLPADGWGAVASNKEARELAPEEAKRLASWRRAMLHAPSNKPKRGQKHTQLQRLQALAGRVEYLWDLVRRRLELSETDIRRDINVWGAEDLPPAPASPVSREQILQDLEAPGTPYWRLKTVMDTWCALWFWPLDRADQLDGSAPEYQTTTTVTKVVDEPVYEVHYEAPALDIDFGQDEQLTLPIPGRKIGTRQTKKAAPMRRTVPLANMDDWLEFAEAMLGRQHLTTDQIVSELASLSVLSDFEDSLAAMMGMDQVGRLADRFSWLTTAEKVSGDQNFFHWELTFAHVFAVAGFDLQVGNPPWVRPEWKEKAALASYDPWFALIGTGNAWDVRRRGLLASSQQQLMSDFVGTAAISGFLGSACNYSRLAGTQPNLYRCFMAKTWEHAKESGTSGLIHYDTHMVGIHERKFRATTYHHLRLNAHFHNRRLIFPEVNWNKQFSLNIYGSPREIDFVHLSWLYDPGTLVPSLSHDGTGPLPRPKLGRTWNLHPHRSRVIHVTPRTLRHWQEFANDFDVPVEQTRILYPFHVAEEAAIERIGGFGTKMSGFDRIDLGVLDGELERAGALEKKVTRSSTWAGAILRGAQFGISTPFAKEPPKTTNVDKTIDLRSLPESAKPVSAFRIIDSDALDRFQSISHSAPSISFYRLMWREMAPISSERSLIASLIPPGPMHLSSVRSLAMETNLLTVLAVGFWSSLPIDYAIRVSGRDHVTDTDVRRLPGPAQGHPLAIPLAIRVLRLNALTSAYSEIWGELYMPRWKGERWAIGWPPAVGLLGDLSGDWNRDVPLRAEVARRAALLEIDAIVAAWLGLSADALVTIYLARFPQLSDYEDEMFFDANGRKVANNYNAHGWGQAREDYRNVVSHVENGSSVPAGYLAPFYRPDREAEYRQAHAVFSRRLQDAIDAGWSPS